MSKSGRFLRPAELEPYNFEVHESVSELPLAGLEPDHEPAEEPVAIPVPEPAEGPAPEPVVEPVPEPAEGPAPEPVEGPAPKKKKKRICFLKRLFSGVQVSVDFNSKKD